ncbi:MAG: DUF1028 domain-containing protein [Acidobacteriales bacterium]|nr:DUF1028 domain-containing protein [Terriglobales bacterium]
MKRLAILSLFISPLFAQEMLRPPRPVHTFSIVARDPQTGEIGVAVQSHWFAVGQRVAWAEAGVGAVATQSFTDPAYGKLGLDMMRAGKSAPDALLELVTKDKGAQVRQAGFVDAQGRAAGWTGKDDIASAGDACGSVENLVERSDPPPKRENGVVHSCIEFSAQANLMANDRIWPAMAKAFEESKGDLADRMLAALDAAQAAGGDVRGRQSAALIVVKAKSNGKPWEDRIFDLRVDDAETPLKELRRLVTLQRAYNHMNAGDDAVEHKDNESALREYSTAEKMIEGMADVDQSRLAEMIFWHAVALVNMKRVDESLPLFQRAFKMHPQWREVVPRLTKPGLLPDDPSVIRKIAGL